MRRDPMKRLYDKELTVTETVTFKINSGADGLTVAGSVTLTFINGKFSGYKINALPTPGAILGAVMKDDIDVTAEPGSRQYGLIVEAIMDYVARHEGPQAVEKAA